MQKRDKSFSKSATISAIFKEIKEKQNQNKYLYPLLFKALGDTSYYFNNFDRAQLYYQNALEILDAC